ERRVCAIAVAFIAGTQLGQYRRLRSCRRRVLQEAPRTAGLRRGIEEDFDLGLRKNFCAYVPAFHDYAPARSHLLLAPDHPLADRRMHGNLRSSFGDGLAANTIRYVLAIEQHAIPFLARHKLDARLAGQSRQSSAIIEGNARLDRL